MPDLRSHAEHYYHALPNRVRRYLNARGISDEVIALHILGWNGSRITIPIFNKNGDVAFFKLAKDPEDQSETPKMLLPPGSSVELYGWERVRSKPPRIVICEGEFDRLVLESHGLAAVSSTGGAGVFRFDWAKEFQPIPEVYICFDRDRAGREGAERMARLIRHAKIVELPPEVGEGGDITDFFVRLGRTRDDFLQLLATAEPCPIPDPAPKDKQVAATWQTPPGREVDRIKAAIDIEEFVAHYLPLKRSGQTLVGRCPFHDDRKPSFNVYPKTQTYHCFGCQEHGDVISFLMKHEILTFPEAIQTLQKMTP